MSSTRLYHGAPIWSKEEDEILRKFVAQFGPRSALCARTGVLPGRTAGGINHRMHFLNLVSNPRKSRPWIYGPGGDLQPLHQLSEKAKLGSRTIHKLGIFPERTLPALNTKMSRENLGDPKVKKRAKKASRLTPKKEAEMTPFLLGPGRETCTVEVTALYNVTRDNVLTLRKKLGVPLTRKQAFNSEPARKSLENKPEVLAKGLAAYHKNFRKRRRKELLVLFRKMQAAGCKAQTKLCSKCNEPWFETLDFYYKGRPHADGTYGWLSVCRACGIPWKKKTKSERRSKKKH
jgi:hypothetical protein